MSRGARQRKSVVPEKAPQLRGSIYSFRERRPAKHWRLTIGLGLARPAGGCCLSVVRPGFGGCLTAGLGQARWASCGSKSFPTAAGLSSSDNRGQVTGLPSVSFYPRDWLFFRFFLDDWSDLFSSHRSSQQPAKISQKWPCQDFHVQRNLLYDAGKQLHKEMAIRFGSSRLVPVDMDLAHRPRGRNPWVRWQAA